MKIRPVKETDAQGILDIYTPYIANTAITFECDIPHLAEFKHRVNQTAARFPYFVAEDSGNIVGYAYASTYYDRTAYDWTAELSIYVRQDIRGKGVGEQLYTVLENALKEQGFVNLLACISLPNDASIHFHLKNGFKKVGFFEKIGYKLNQWHDIIWMQKRLIS